VPPETFKCPSQLFTCTHILFADNHQIRKYSLYDPTFCTSFWIQVFRQCHSLPVVQRHWKPHANARKSTHNKPVSQFNLFPSLPHAHEFKKNLSRSNEWISCKDHMIQTRQNMPKKMTQFFQSNQICLPTRYSKLVDTCLQLFGCEKAVYFAKFWKYGLPSKIAKSNAP
jgi:hypothetical protein